MIGKLDWNILKTTGLLMPKWYISYDKITYQREEFLVIKERKFLGNKVRYILKACVRYFLSNFYFSQNDSPLKTMKNVFLFHLKSSFRSRDIQIFVIFSLPFQTFQIQKGRGRWNNLWCHELICINLQM